MYSISRTSLRQHAIVLDGSGDIQKRASRRSERKRRSIALHFLQADFGPASKSAIKCRIRSALTQVEAAIAIATSLHR